MKYILIVLSALLLSGCACEYVADYGIVISIAREPSSNKVTIAMADNPYEVSGTHTLIIHTHPSIKYMIGDTIHFVKTSQTYYYEVE